MARYRVVRYFEDLKDNNHPYNVGDEFPRNGCGYTVTNDRLYSLSTANNAQNCQLIEQVNGSLFDDLSEYGEKRYTKTDIQRMSTEKLHNLAFSEGIEDAYDKSGNELKKILFEHFGL